MRNKRKVPAGPKAQPGKVGHAASSRKQPKAKGIEPGQAKWGITQTGPGPLSKKANRASAMFGNASRNTPTGQGRLESKAHRQVY